MSRTFAGAPPNPLSLGRIFCRHPPRCWRPQHSIKSVIESNQRVWVCRGRAAAKGIICGSPVIHA